MTIPTYSDLCERGRKICSCKPCCNPDKHPCHRAMWAALTALELFVEMEGPVCEGGCGAHTANCGHPDYCCAACPALPAECPECNGKGCVLCM